MTSLRRRTGLLAVLALVLASCASTEEASPPPTTEALRVPAPSTSSPTATIEEPTAPTLPDRGPWILGGLPLDAAPGPPRLLVSVGDRVVRVDGSATVEVLGADDLPVVAERYGLAAGDGRGVVVAEALAAAEDGVTSQLGLVVDGPDGIRTLSLPTPRRAVALHDLVVVGGATHVLYALFQDPTSAGPSAVLRRIDLASGADAVLAPATDDDALLVDASAAISGLVLTFRDDGTGRTLVLDPDGGPSDVPGPAASLGDEPPGVVAADLSVDGAEVASLEAPRTVTSDEGVVSTVGDWQVVVDDADGEQLRLTVADASLTSVDLDFDGRWIVLSGSGADGPVDPLLIDTESTDLATYLVEGLAGPASIDVAASRP